MLPCTVPWQPLPLMQCLPASRRTRRSRRPTPGGASGTTWARCGTPTSTGGTAPCAAWPSRPPASGAPRRPPAPATTSRRACARQGTYARWQLHDRMGPRHLMLAPPPVCASCPACLHRLCTCVGGLRLVMPGTQPSPLQEAVPHSAGARGCAVPAVHAGPGVPEAGWQPRHACWSGRALAGAGAGRASPRRSRASRGGRVTGVGAWFTRTTD